MEDTIDAARRIKNQMDRRRKGGIFSVVFGLRDRQVIAYASNDDALQRYHEPDCDWRWIGRYSRDVPMDQLCEDIEAWIKEKGKRI